MKNEPNGRTKSLVAAGVLVASLAAIPVAASAQSGEPAKDQSSEPAPVETAPIETATIGAVDADGTLDDEMLEAEEVEIADLDEETLAEIQALEQELADGLDEAGVAYEWVEEDGLRFVEIDWDDDAAVEAFETVAEDVFGDMLDGEIEFDGEFEGDFEEFDFEWTEEDLAEFTAEQNDLAAALDEAGVDYEWVEEDDIRFVEIDWDDEAAIEAYLDFYGEDLEDLDLEEMDDEDTDLDDWELSAEEIAEFNAETEELVAALEAEGIPVTVETEDDGLLIIDIDSEDDAVWDRAFEIFEETFGEAIEVEEFDADDFDADELDDDETVDGNSTEG